MNRSGLIIAGAVAVVALTAVLLFTRQQAQPTAELTGPAAEAVATVTRSPSASLPAVEATPPPASAPTAAAAPAAPTVDDEDTTEITFRADDKGRMVTNEQARLNLERLFALYTPAQRQAKLDELAATLPPAAGRDLADLMERYINYDTAQRQTFPPGQDLSSPEDGLNVIEGMHNLRVQYFGAEVANAFFGREEKIQRELLRLMSLDKDDSMTIEEKAERAQALYQSQMPETTAEIAAGRKPRQPAN